ncbi:MAG: pentapeptide repeat-containing protein [Rhodobiaceae bacterium]|nr:pentapeptide repeat-containing protein [Rhodobiaceae bacterium]
MTETLLSASNVILFGRRMGDLKIVVPREEYRGPGLRFEADFVLGRPVREHIRSMVAEQLEHSRGTTDGDDVETETVSLLGAIYKQMSDRHVLGPGEIGKISVEVGDFVLLKGESDKSDNGLFKVVKVLSFQKEVISSGYEVTDADDVKTIAVMKRYDKAHSSEAYKEGVVVTANIGDSNDLDGRTFILNLDKLIAPKSSGEPAVTVASDEGTSVAEEGGEAEAEKYCFYYELPPRNRRHGPFVSDRMGANRQVENQLLKRRRPCLARIYGFSYEGKYYELDHPSIFLVHGSGELVSGIAKGEQDAQWAKSPGDPSISGMSAADFQFADELRAWSYDRADYTIRMEMDSGMFEQVLLEPSLGGGSVAGAKLSGAKVSGAKVSGAKVSGAKVSGAKVSGAKLSGDASD